MRGTVFDVGRGTGVVYEGGDPGGEGGHAQVEPGQELFGEFELVVSLVGVGEGAHGLGGCALACDAVSIVVNFKDQ